MARRDLLDRFAGRILTVDGAVARRWGALRASTVRRGRTMPVVDALLAATAVEHDLAVVIRNVHGLTGLGAPVVDPWSGTDG